MSDLYDEAEGPRGFGRHHTLLAEWDSPVEHAVTLTHHEHWTDNAACRGMKLEAFFGHVRNAPVCEQCPVKRQCAEMAAEMERYTDARYRFGIFAGLTPSARRAS